MHLATCVLVASLALAQSDGVDDAAVPPKVLAVYTEGKAAYDAKDYLRAIEKFDQCVDLEPARARWHYNRGLTLKKLKRDSEAREAFADSQRLDPTYKQKEIVQKLSELGIDSAPADVAVEPVSNTGQKVGAGIACLSLPLLFGLGAIFFIVKRFRSRGQPGPSPAPKPRIIDAPATRPDLDEGRLSALAQRQARLEHALASDNDAQGQALVNVAGNALLFVRLRALQGQGGRSFDDALNRATAALDAAQAHWAAKPPGWDSVRGERVGCFFCARPLAAKSARRKVELAVEGGQRPVVACEVCARNVSAGTPMNVRMHRTGSNLQHWAEVPSFDPYQHAYWSGPQTEDVPVWKAELSNQRLEGISAVLGLAAMGAGVASLGVLDVLSARESGLAAEAAAAAANNASRSTRGDGWKDHS